MKNGKSNFGFSYTYIKYGKFWSISLGHFIKHKLLIFEECTHKASNLPCNWINSGTLRNCHKILASSLKLVLTFRALTCRAAKDSPFSLCWTLNTFPKVPLLTIEKKSFRIFCVEKIIYYLIHINSDIWHVTVL